MRILWQCERDAYRRGVLAERFPGVPCYEDVREIDVPAGADLLCGGFPCQDLSVAGRRAGLAGSRSGLFFEFARVAGSLRPRWLLVENVCGLLSSNGGRDFGVVLGTLADVGYGVAWRILDSRFFGVPQRRRRVFIVGALVVGDPRAAAGRAGQVLAVGTRCERHSAARGEAGEDTPVASLSGLGSGGPDDNDGQGGRLVTAFHVTQDPISGEVAPAMSKGNRTGTGTIGAAVGTTVRRLTPREAERLQGFPDNWTTGPDSRRYAALGDAVTVNVAQWLGERIMAAA